METQPCLFCAGAGCSACHRDEAPPFGGETYEPARDGERLAAQLGRVRTALSDHDWHTLWDLETRTGDPQASISARIRDLRKEKFGGHQVDRRYEDAGLWAYRWVPADEAVEG